MNDVAVLRDRVRHFTECEATHTQSVEVAETFKGHAWSGTVEVFELISHPKAKQCYAWNYKGDDGRTGWAMFLGFSSADSPQRAVQKMLAMEVRKKKKSK